MSLLKPNSIGTVIVRAADAETTGKPPNTVRLLADSEATGGALTTQRVTLSHGADGATPHHHKTASELFFVLHGSAQILSGEQVLTAHEGDLIVVPSLVAHAFAAAPGCDADLLVVLTPGVERFGYFRLLERFGRGDATLEDVLASQETYDNYFFESPVWKNARKPA